MTSLLMYKYPKMEEKSYILPYKLFSFPVLTNEKSVIYEKLVKGIKG